MREHDRVRVDQRESESRASSAATVGRGDPAKRPTDAPRRAAWRHADGRDKRDSFADNGAMATEIERKFLVAAAWPRPAQGTRLLQGYLSRGGPVSVRVRTSGHQAWLTVKGPTSGLARAEFEYEIPTTDAEEMLALSRSGVIEKTRYLVPHGRHVLEVDVFAGDNAGLVVAEVELESEDDVFTKPDWLGEEVSADPRYRNSALAEHPFSTWPVQTLQGAEKVFSAPCVLLRAGKASELGAKNPLFVRGFRTSVFHRSARARPSLVGRVLFQHPARADLETSSLANEQPGTANRADQNTGKNDPPRQSWRAFFLTASVLRPAPSSEPHAEPAPCRVLLRADAPNDLGARNPLGLLRARSVRPRDEQ